MRLEEILQAEDQQTVREEAGSALAQVERLATVVEHLLDSVRDNNLRAGPVPLDDIVLQQVVEWEPAFAARQPRSSRPPAPAAWSRWRRPTGCPRCSPPCWRTA